MMGRLKFLFFYFIGWVILFECFRGLFLLYHFDKTAHLSFKTGLLSFVYGLRMDMSMAAYIILPVCLFVLLSVFIHSFRQTLVYKIYTAILLLLSLLIISSDLELYGQWGFRIDATPLKYLASPKEAWASVSHLPVGWILLLLAVIYSLLVWIFNRLLHKWSANLHQPVKYWLLQHLIILAFAVLLIIPLRGGFQLAPINQSSVYFSTNSFANHAAINAPWNFLHGVLNNTGNTTNPYRYMDDREARRVVDSLYLSSGNVEKIIKGPRPNVILIIWESFTEKAIHLRVDGAEVTPRFNALKKQGIYFSNLYASGDRTDKGLAAVLSGYPALPQHSILRSPGKVSKLPVLPALFQKKGYSTPFYYGGEPEFANIKSYLLNAGFSPLITKDDFADKDQNSKWGAHDGVVADKLFADLSESTQPFFATWLTLSSHEPFETPVPAVIKGSDHTRQFLNSLHYTDDVVGKFIAQCQQQPWWQNTVVVIVADHGHVLPETGKREDNFRIPMLWLGGALQKQDFTVEKKSSQLDLATTLCYQAGIQSSFPFSKNIFDSTSKAWSFFTYNNGFGFAQSGSSYLFDNVGQLQTEQNGTVDAAAITAGKALQQHTYADYLSR